MKQKSTHSINVKSFKLLNGFLTAAFVSILTGCFPWDMMQSIKKGCDYQSVGEGKAEIKSVEFYSFEDSEGKTIEAADVTYDYVPESETSRNEKRIGLKLRGNGDNPSAECVRENGIAVGTFHPAESFRTKVQGSCRPDDVLLKNFDSTKCAYVPPKPQK